MPDQKKKKKTAYSRVFLFFGVGSFNFFSYFIYKSFVAKSSTSLFPKIHLIRSEPESVINIEVREGSKSNVTNVAI